MQHNYSGEHLLPGYFGRTMLILGFIATLISLFAYYQASHKRGDRRQWKHIGRLSFYLHSAFMILGGLALLYVIVNRYYEYRYVWAHVSSDLSIWYIFSSFWAGQEGSFLFWTLCQVLFGIILIRSLKEWESPVMTIFNTSQAFMTSMVLGLQILGMQIGRSPFLLLRHSPENLGNPFFQNPDYLTMIVDGNGLNPLLRNFWMLSHPPILFLGFAAVLVTFCFAAAALWTRQYDKWIRPALPWTLAGLLLLGAGLLLGGVWAYESLTFGGFWAWDPVENASLVPWLILIAALHLMLIARKTNSNWTAAFLFSSLAYVFVIYSTFLTRSGVLGDTSVHAFGNDGMAMQILLFLLSFLGIAAYLIIRSIPQIPRSSSDKMFTREFWMFIGSLIVILSAFQIIFTTSIPAINKVLGTQMAPPHDVVAHYNNWQMPFAILIALAIGLTHFIQYGKNDTATFFKHLRFSVIISLVFTILLVIGLGMKHPFHIVFLFASLFALISAIDLILRLKKVLPNTGAIITHLGFAMFLLTILLTFSNSKTISRNTSGFFLGRQFPDNENLLLIKDEILPMGEYFVTYKGRSYKGNRIIFQVDFLKKNQYDQYYLDFSSYPAVLLNERMGNVYEPYSKVFFNKDVFTYISFADLSFKTDEEKVFKEPIKIPIAIGDSVHVNHLDIKLLEIETDARNSEIDFTNLRIEAIIQISQHGKPLDIIRPRFILKNEQILHQDAFSETYGTKIRFAEVSETPNTIILEISERDEDFVIIKTVIFPYINLLWLSCLVLLAGFGVSMRNRMIKKHKKNGRSTPPAITVTEE